MKPRSNPFLRLHEPPQQQNCQAHGDYLASPLLNGNWTGCPRCSEDEMAQQTARETALKANEEQARWLDKLADAAIPPRFQDRTLQNYAAETPGQEKVLAFALDYAEQFATHRTKGTSCVFVGKPGTGKSHLAVGIALHVMRHGFSARYATVQRAVRRIKDTWHRESPERESDALRWMTDVDFLILDEIGVQFGSDFEKNLLFEVLNSRYECRRPSLILSNLSQVEVQGYLGERVVDRIREDGGRVLTFDWASHRRKGIS